MTTRNKLLGRRSHLAIEFTHETLTYTVGIGFNEEGKVAELFLNAGKAGSQAAINARDSAIAASLALQYGCPLETLLHSISRNPDGTPQGPLGAALELALKEND